MRLTQRLIMCGLSLALLIAISFAGCAERKQITEQDRAAATNFYRLAVNSYTQGNVIEALGALKQAEEFNPNDPRIKNLYGLIFLGKRMLDKAEESFEAAIDIDEKYSDAYLHLAIVHMERGNWSKAIELLTVPANDIMYPRKDLAQDNMGWCYFKLGQIDKAIQALISATAENPKLCHAWYNLGRVYKHQGRFVEAMRALENAVRGDACESFLLAHYELGIVAFRAKNFQAAKAALAQCVKLGGDSKEAIECSNYLNMIP